MQDLPRKAGGKYSYIFIFNLRAQKVKKMLKSKNKEKNSTFTKNN